MALDPSRFDCLIESLPISDQYMVFVLRSTKNFKVRIMPPKQILHVSRVDMSDMSLILCRHVADMWQI